MGCVSSSELEPNKDSNFDRASSPQEGKPQIVFERKASENLTEPIPVVDDTPKNIVEVESIEGKFLSALTYTLFCYIVFVAVYERICISRRNNARCG